MSENSNMNTGPDYGYSLTSSADVPPSGPLPLAEAIRQLPDQYIRVLTRPGAVVFAQEQSKAAWDITWVQILISSVVAMLVGFVLFNTSFPSSLASSNVPIQIIQQFRTFSWVFALSYIILMPIFFFIGAGLYYLLAKAFRGKGTFLAHCYCSILYGVPLGIVSGILSVIVALLGLPSLVNTLLAVILSIYGLVLQVFMTMGVHRLSGGKATLAVILVPIILFGFVFVLSFIAIFAVIATHPH
jgi:hypothetical protein